MVLKVISKYIKEGIPATASLIVDLEDYNFPEQIVAMNLCPDIVCWDDKINSLLTIELIILFDMLMDEAARRKECKYENQRPKKQVTTPHY